MPSGARFWGSHVAAAAPMQPPNCALLITGLPADTKAVYGYGVGASKVMRTVSASMASTEAMPSKASLRVQPVASSLQ